MNKKQNPANINFWFRLSKEDKALLRQEANACGVNMSTFLKQCIRYFSTEDKQNLLFFDQNRQKLLNNIRYELNRYGNNLNQIAYKLNRNKNGIALEDIDFFKSQLKDIKNGIADIREKIDFSGS